MATSISGNVSLTYGTHFHSESFSTTTTDLLYSNTSHQYAAGGGRATITPAALKVGEIDAAEGLLLIKNTNTSGHLLVALEGDSNYNIRIPAEQANLISVGTAGVVYLKTEVAQQTGFNVASVTAAGVITFDAYVATVGTYAMKATANPNNASGPFFIMKTTTANSLTGTVYELDGTTKKDLTGGGGYSSTTVVTLDNIVDYRYTLTEA